MSNAAFVLGTKFKVACHCIVCSVPVVMAETHETTLRNNHRTFYCINGHPMSWGQETELEKTKKLLETERRWRKESDESKNRHIDTLCRSVAAHKGQITKIKNRIGNGVCPCCNRTFQNLMKHMHTQHPEYKEP